MSTNQDNHRIFLVPRSELKNYIKVAYDETHCDALGYDLSVGNIHVVTQGKIEKFKTNTELKVFPGDTLIISSEEKIDLPQDVFAMGAPKMRLLIDGLWGHGGKTDPGFSGNLTLCFHHVGNVPVTLRKNQSIFHLTFFKLVQDEYLKYPGKGPDWPENPIKSPLDIEGPFNTDALEAIKEYEGIDIYRVCKQIKLLKESLSLLHGNGSEITVLKEQIKDISAKNTAFQKLGCGGISFALMLAISTPLLSQNSLPLVWGGCLGIFAIVAFLNHFFSILEKVSKYLWPKAQN